MSAVPPSDRSRLLFEQLRRLAPLTRLRDSALKEVAEALAQAEPSTPASSPGSEPDHLAAVVHEPFPSASGDIARRHLEAVREERTQRLIAGILQSLGGPGATLPDLLLAAGRAVTDPVAESLGSIPVAEFRRRLDAWKGRPPEAGEIEDLKALLQRRASAPIAEPAALAQVALAASQAVQQAAFNIQKILTVALEAERAADATNPKYYYP